MLFIVCIRNQPISILLSITKFQVPRCLDEIQIIILFHLPAFSDNSSSSFIFCDVMISSLRFVWCKCENVSI